MIDERAVAALAEALGLYPAAVTALTEAANEQLTWLARLWEADVSGTEARFDAPRAER